MSSLPTRAIPNQLSRDVIRRQSFGPDLRRRSRPNSTGQPLSNVEHESTGFHPVSGVRQDTLDSQGSHNSQSSDRSANRARITVQRRLSDADRNKLPVSMMSLPDYRDADLQFYWPTSHTSPTLCRVDKFEVKENPEREFRRFDQMVQRTEKSQIWSVALLTEAGNQEHVALKLVPCKHAANSKEFKETIQKEYNLLAGLNHKHIIAPVGSYVEGKAGAWYYGLLLFPLAPYSLRMLLVEVSEHNGVRSKLPNPVEWKIDKRSTQLLDYFACLCQALIYLHSQEQPIKHRDIKCDNVLVDKHGTVILADFDIAKKYTTMAFVVTTGATSFTPETAPQSVKDGRKRGLESDVFSLGCVFLETASVAFGETLQTYGQHLCGGKTGTCEHSDALKSGTIDTWINRLKTQASLCPQNIPTGHFGKTADIGEDVKEFLDMISAMLHVKLGDDQEALLASAWRCFSKFSTKTCQHCCPGGAKTDHDARPGLRVPAISARWKPVSETISEGSSASSMSGDPPLPKINGDLKLDQSVVEGIAAATSASTAGVSPELPMAADSHKTTTTNGHHYDIVGEELKKADSMLAPNSPQSDFDGIPNASLKYSMPEITFSNPPSDQHPAAYQTDRGFSMAAATRDVQPAVAGASDEAEKKRRRSRTPDSRDSDDSDIDDHQRPIHPPLGTRPDGKITENVVRVLTFTPRERRGVSQRQKDAIVNTRLLQYENDQFTVIKPGHIDQRFLDGAFFDIPPNCNVSYRMPRSLESPGGELLDLRDNLGWQLRWSCWIGPFSGTRIRLMYVPGRFTDKALKECVVIP